MKGYFNKIRESLNVKKLDFYELPEKSLGLEQYQQERGTLEKHWDSFKYNLESQGVFSAEEITVRARELGEQIRKVRRLIPQIEPRGQVKQYSKKLEKRLELVRYIQNLEANDGFDFDRLEEGQDIGAEHANAELSSLHRNRRYWRNIGSAFNELFDKQLKWEGKVELLDLNIKEEEERLKREDERGAEEPAEEKIEEVEEEADAQDPSEAGEAEAPAEPESPRTIEEEDEDESETERLNQKLERSIRKIEQEKRQIEVR